MAAACRSQPSTPAETEDGATCQLTLTTLAGNDILMPTNIREHDLFEALEDLIVELLPTVSQIDNLAVKWT